MTDKGITTKSGVYISEATLDEIAGAFEQGEWSGTTTRIMRGRPPICGERLKSITYKDTASDIAAMDKRAASLKMSRSEYLRFLVKQDVGASGIS